MFLKKKEKTNFLLKNIFFSLSLFFFSAMAAQANFFSAGSQGQHFLNLIGEEGYGVSVAGPPSGSIFDLITSIINYALSFVAIIFLGLIIYGGYIWMFAAGEESKVLKAKKIISNSIMGMVILLLSGAIVHTVSSFFSSTTFSVSSSGVVTSSVSFKQVIVNIINYVLSFLGIAFLGFVIYGGYLWMFSAGDSQKINRAKKILINAAVGAVIILLSFSIVRIVARLVS